METAKENKKNMIHPFPQGKALSDEKVNITVEDTNQKYPSFPIP